jgi:hypothetical protein
MIKKFFKKLLVSIRKAFDWCFVKIKWCSIKVVWFFSPFTENWLSMSIAPFISIIALFMFIPYLVILYTHIIIFTSNYFDNSLRPQWGLEECESIQIKRWVPRARDKIGWLKNAANFYFIKLPKIRAYLFLSDLVENKRWPKKCIPIIWRGFCNILLTPWRATRTILIELYVSRGDEKFWLHFLENLLSVYFENYQSAYHTVFRLYSKSQINRFR